MRLVEEEAMEDGEMISTVIPPFAFCKSQPKLPGLDPAGVCWVVIATLVGETGLACRDGNSTCTAVCVADREREGILAV